MESKELKEYWQGFPEAPYSDTFKWVDADGYEHMMTVRGWEGGAVLGAIGKAKEVISGMNGKPVNNRPTQAPINDTTKIQVKTEDGLPVVDPEGNPVMTSLPTGHHMFTVKEVYHDTNKDGDKHMLKVVLEESYEFGNGKYGISCFHPESHFDGWKNWEKGKRFAPPVNAAKVIIRDPKQGGKYADVVEFRPA